jgi:DNA (cytosine-5)-methyltransferase 1
MTETEKPLKILNLYAGIGGNRKLWGDKHKITAVEIEPSIAEAYLKFFPNDKVIVADAHQFLLEHFKEFDFIWSSPPCPSHSVLGMLAMVQNKKKYCYPDMRLYQEIIFLKRFAKCKWVVENTKSYYEPFIKPFESGNHYFWSNFFIGKIENDGCRAVSINKINEKEKVLGFDLSEFSFSDIEGTHKKDKVLNNCVEPKLGLHIFKMAFKDKQKTISEMI